MTVDIGAVNAVRAPGAAAVISEASQPRRSLDRAETVSTVAETATLADPVHDATTTSAALFGLRPASAGSSIE